MEKGKGIVIRRTKGFYYLRNSSGDEVECKIKGKFFKNSRFNNQIAVGDKVGYSFSKFDSVGLIDHIEERSSFLSRNRVGVEAEQVIAANVDYLFIVSSVREPPFRNNLINRMLVAATVGNLTPVLVVTKTDLSNPDEINQLLEPYRQIDLEIIQSSIKNESDANKLIDFFTGSICVLAGQSGVGKSSLLNKLFPDLNLKVGAVSAKTFKGSHTTTYASMRRVADDSYVIDTPGIREFGLWNVTKENLGEIYPLIRDYHSQCKHRNCRHVHEPKCTVKDAVQNGEINDLLYQGYLSI